MQLKIEKVWLIIAVFGFCSIQQVLSGDEGSNVLTLDCGYELEPLLLQFLKVGDGWGAGINYERILTGNFSFYTSSGVQQLQWQKEEHSNTKDSWMVGCGLKYQIPDILPWDPYIALGACRTYRQPSAF